MLAKQVAVRVRPFNQREKDLGAVNIIEMVHDGGKQQLKINDKCRGPTVHTFDFCFWSFFLRPVHKLSIERDGFILC